MAWPTKTWGKEDDTAKMSAESLLEGETVGVAAPSRKAGERTREAIRRHLPDASKHLADAVKIYVSSKVAT